MRLAYHIREPLLLPAVSGETRTIIVNPFSGQHLVPAFTVQAMDIKEAYAEKVRAALTRTEPSIRDLFDLFYAVRKMKLDLATPDFLTLLKKKLDVPGNTPVRISSEYKRDLNRQLEGQLRPVLRPTDYDGFNMNEAFELIVPIAEAVSE